jgi:hypothetical protein
MSIPYEELTLSDFEKLVSSTNSTILCGNGLSINFDNRLSMDNLGKSLYRAHCTWEKHSIYNVISNAAFEKKLLENYTGAKKIIKRVKNEEDLKGFFNSAILFSSQIIRDGILIKWLNNNGYNSPLVFGVSQIDILSELISEANTKGVFSVNYEYWSLVVYFILAVSKAPDNIYTLDKANYFVDAVLIGGLNNFLNTTDSASITGETIMNGVTIYLRFLFAINILLDGSSVYTTKLSNWDMWDISKIKDLFSKFDHLLTTNYDRVIENITGRTVRHLHGEYTEDENIVFNQSMSVMLNNSKFDLSTVILGDYFCGKTFLMNTAKKCAGSFPNSLVQYYTETIEDIIRAQKTKTFVLFGLRADNDFHIIRDLQVFMGLEKTQNAQIVYCYYGTDAKNGFLNIYDKCISYGSELNNFVRNNIKVSLIDTKEILAKHFVKLY